MLWVNNIFFIRELKHPPLPLLPITVSAFGQSPKACRCTLARKNIWYRGKKLQREKRRKRFMSEITGPHVYGTTSTRTFDALRRRYSPKEIFVNDRWKTLTKFLSLRMFLLKERRPQPKVEPGHFVILISLPNHYTAIPTRQNSKKFTYIN